MFREIAKRSRHGSSRGGITVSEPARRERALGVFPAEIRQEESETVTTNTG